MDEREERANNQLDFIARNYAESPTKGEGYLVEFISVFKNPRYYDTPEAFIQSVNYHLTKRGIFIDPDQLAHKARLWYEFHV